jgi:hypothetical protein
MMTGDFFNIPMSYELWYVVNEESILIELAETGADREFGFDLENEFIDRYQKYLKTHELISKT